MVATVTPIGGVQVIIVPDNNVDARNVPPGILAMLGPNDVLVSNDSLRMYVRASHWENMKRKFQGDDQVGRATWTKCLTPSLSLQRRPQHRPAGNDKDDWNNFAKALRVERQQIRQIAPRPEHPIAEGGQAEPKA